MKPCALTRPDGRDLLAGKINGFGTFSSEGMGLIVKRSYRLTPAADSLKSAFHGRLRHRFYYEIDAIVAPRAPRVKKKSNIFCFLFVFSGRGRYDGRGGGDRGDAAFYVKRGQGCGIIGKICVGDAVFIRVHQRNERFGIETARFCAGD